MSRIQFVSESLQMAAGLLRRESFFSPLEVRLAASALNALEKAMEKGQDRTADFVDDGQPALIRKLAVRAYQQGMAGSATVGLSQLRSVLGSPDLPAFERPTTTVPFKISPRAKVVLKQLFDGTVLKGVEIDQIGEVLGSLGDSENRDPVDTTIRTDAHARAKELIEIYLAGQVRDENNRKVGIPGHMSQGLVELMDAFGVA